MGGGGGGTEMRAREGTVARENGRQLGEGGGGKGPGESSKQKETARYQETTQRYERGKGTGKMCVWGGGRGS